MGKIERHVSPLEEIARKEKLAAEVDVAKSRHGRYLRVTVPARNGEEFHRAFTLAEKMRRHAEKNKIHAAMDVVIPGEEYDYVLHIPMNYKKGPYKLPRISGTTLHHGSKAEQPGKIAIATAIADDRKIYDDVGIIRQYRDGTAEVLTDFDVFGVKTSPHEAEIHIGEVFTDHYDRVNHKAVIWADFLRTLERTGIRVKRSAPIVLVVADPHTKDRVVPAIRSALVNTGFKRHGFIEATYGTYGVWKDIVSSVARIPLESHEKLLKPAQRALVRGDLWELTAWQQLFKAIADVRKQINKGLKRGNAFQIEAEILRFPEHLRKAGEQNARDPVNAAIHRVMWGITQHLPRDARNGLAKRYPPNKYKI